MSHTKKCACALFFTHFLRSFCRDLIAAALLPSPDECVCAYVCSCVFVYVCCSAIQIRALDAFRLLCAGPFKHPADKYAKKRGMLIMPKCVRQAQRGVAPTSCRLQQKYICEALTSSK